MTRNLDGRLQVFYKGADNVIYGLPCKLRPEQHVDGTRSALVVLRLLQIRWQSRMPMDGLKYSSEAVTM